MSSHGKFDPNKKPGGAFPKKTYFKMKDNSNLYRVLPPFKSLSQTGEIAKYWPLFWLTDSEGRKRAVPSIQRKSKEGKIIQNDPILDKINAMKQMVEQAKAAGENPQVIEQMTKRIQSYDLDKKYYLNVMNPAGEIGVLGIRYTAFNNFMEKLKKLNKEGIDAINAGVGCGVFFDFQKTKDERGKTIYPVDVATRTYRDPINPGKINVEYMMAPIDDTVLARMEQEAFDLGKMYQVKTLEEMASLATLDPAMVSRVFARPEKVETKTTAEDPPELDVDEEIDTTFHVPSPQPTGMIAKSQQTVPSQPMSAVATLTGTPATEIKSSVLANEDVKKFLFGK